MRQQAAARRIQMRARNRRLSAHEMPAPATSSEIEEVHETAPPAVDSAQIDGDAAVLAVAAAAAAIPAEAPEVAE